ncbi:jg2798, partial [Pararge aegeria aegeria]
MAFKVEDLNIRDVIKVLECWEMTEFVEFVKEKEINGRKLLETSEGLINIWRPNANAKKLILFIQEMKQNPQKYINCIKNDDVITIKETNLCSDSQYQTVSIRKISQQDNSNNRVDEILKKITAPKSFLYKHHAKRQQRSVTSYVPMNVNTEKKPRNFFRLSSYDYPIFDLKKRFTKTEHFTDRGYYPVNKTSKEVRPKYKSMSSTEEFNDKLPEDHFYEDLCYNDVKEDNNSKTFSSIQNNQVKPCMVKIQELFQSFKLPFFKKTEEVVTNKPEDRSIIDSGRAKDGNIYENTSIDMYDSVHVATHQDLNKKEDNQAGLAVEDYLVPVQVFKDYCDVCVKQKDDSLLGYIMNYFESRFGIRR